MGQQRDNMGGLYESECGGKWVVKMAYLYDVVV